MISRQRRLPIGGVRQHLALLIQSGQPFLQAEDPRLELCLLDHSLGIAVDQPAHAPAQLGDLSLQRRSTLLTGPAVAGLSQPAFVFGCQACRILQQLLDLLPHGDIQQVGAHLPVGADPVPPKR